MTECRSSKPAPLSLVHPIPPLYDRTSQVLILGSFPSVKSREMGFFYGHPQNRFWKVLAALYHEPAAVTVPERRAFLLAHHIAAWDVIHSCEITGSSDASIKNAVPNDLAPLLVAAPIQAIYTNGRTAEKLYQKYIEPTIHRPCLCLPSTSPANAAWSLERLTEAWKIIVPEPGAAGDACSTDIRQS